MNKTKQPRSHGDTENGDTKKTGAMDFALEKHR
jgi:hypothetical protein